MESPLKWPTWLILLILATVVLGAGMPQIFRNSIEYDEAISLMVVAGKPNPVWPEKVVNAGSLKNIFAGSAGPAEISRILRKTDVHPPLYFWLLGGWRTLFGNSLEVARIISLLCTLGTAIMLGMLIRRARGGVVMPLFAALFFVLSPIGAYVSVTARPYALAYFLFVGSLWAAIENVMKGAEEHSSIATVILGLLSGFLAGLAVLTNYLAAISVLLLGLWLFTLSIFKRRKRVAVYFTIGSIAPLSFAAWMLMGQLGARPGQFPSFEGMSLFYKYSMMALKMFAPYGFFSPLLKSHGSQIALGFMILAIMIGFISAIVESIRNAERKEFWSVIALLGLGYLIAFTLLSAAMNITFLALRYTYLSIPFLACFAALGCDGRYGKWRLGMLLAVPIFALQIFWTYEAVARYKTSQGWRDLAQDAQLLPGKETLVLIDAGFGRGVPASMVYELPDDSKVRMLTKNTDLRSLSHEVKPYQYVFMVNSWQAAGRLRLADFRSMLSGLDGYVPLYSDKYVVVMGYK